MKVNRFLQTLFCCLLFAAALTLNSCAEADEAPVPDVLAQDVIDSPYLIDEDGSISLRTDCDGSNVHWEYEGLDGPGHWGDLCPSWACNGNAQSPVNIIPPPTRQKSKSLYFYWKNSNAHIVNNGHTIQFNYDQPADLNSSSASYLTLNGQKYHLLQFHFHAASEHTVKGEHFPLEAHFVHQNMTNGKLAVIGVLFKEGAASPFFDQFIQHMPVDEGNYDDTNTSYNGNVLMPEFYNHWLNQHFWWYEGSLTTPPCSEIVSWFVMTDPVTASQDQLEAMEGLLDENYRPAQALNSRLVKAQ